MWGLQMRVAKTRDGPISQNRIIDVIDLRGETSLATDNFGIIKLKLRSIKTDVPDSLCRLAEFFRHAGRDYTDRLVRLRFFRSAGRVTSSRVSALPQIRRPHVEVDENCTRPHGSDQRMAASSFRARARKSSKGAPVAPIHSPDNSLPEGGRSCALRSIRRMALALEPF